MPTKKAALLAVGGLSKPSKMPGHGWSIPATMCKTGSKLVKIPGSVCSGCYALKGRYAFGRVKTALHKRLNIFNANPNLWVDNMVIAIEKVGDSHFRWFDSGDIQSEEMLQKIILVARRTPGVLHWLPTKELGVIKRFLDQGGYIPPNLCVRVSLPMVDDMTDSKLTKHSRVTMSAVSSKGNHTCPAPMQNNKCWSCRMCWDAKVHLVVYNKH